MSERRLIEEYLPVRAVSYEATREKLLRRRDYHISMLHYWWARRPLVASRAAVLASVLPADADRERFLHVLGIHGDPVHARRKIDSARRTGVRVENPYDWSRAFSHSPDTQDRAWLAENFIAGDVSVLDPTAGGGSIPFEAARLGLGTLGNDLNPVAALITRVVRAWYRLCPKKERRPPATLPHCTQSTGKGSGAAAAAAIVTSG